MSDTRMTDRLSRWRRACLVAAVVGILLCLLLAMLDWKQFLQSYLLGFIFWWSVAVGSLGLMMVHNLVGGRWGALARPFFAAGAATLPLLAVLFLPIALGVNSLYPWAQPEYLADHPLVEKKRVYLNVPFFYVRAVVYFAVWLIFAAVAGAWRGAETPASPRVRWWSGIGEVALFLTVSFAAIDWMMSLEPQWFSTMYGALTAMGGALAAMALAAMGAAVFAGRRPRVELLGDLGSLLLAFVMLWAYFAFSQYLIVWSANLPEEVVWFSKRLSGLGGWIAAGVMIFQFAVPFGLLLSRDNKRSPVWLGGVAALVFVMQFIYTFWTLTPGFYKTGIAVHWGDLVAPLAVGAIWITVMMGALPRHFGERKTRKR